MALAAKLQLRQSQSLVMTPQLMQSIQLLQLTHVELDRFVDEEIERNPLLERVETARRRAPVERRREGATRPRAEDADWFSEDNGGLERRGDRRRSSTPRWKTSFRTIPAPRERLGPDLTAQWKSAAGTGSQCRRRPTASISRTGGRRASRCATMSASRSRFAFADPAARLIAAELADGLDEAGYLRADLAEIAERLGATGSDVARRAGRLPDLRSGRPVRARPRRMPGAAARRARPASIRRCAALVANLDLLARRDFADAEADLRRRRGRSARHAGRDPGARSAARAWPFPAAPPTPSSPMSMVRPASDGSWPVELNADTLPRVLVDQIYFAQVSRPRQEPGREGVPRRLPAERQLADPQPRPARQDHPQGGVRDRAPAGRLPRPRRPAPAAAQPAHRRRRHRHARIDGQPRHRQQIHADAARRVRAALFLHRLDRLGRGRRRAFLGSGARPHPAADRRGDGRSTCFPTTPSWIC